MGKRKMLIFHPALAPYRIDFFNLLSDKFDAGFYFNLDNLTDQKFNQDELRNKIRFKINLLSGFEIFNRSLRFGIINILLREKPELVLCSEYNQTTLTVILFKILFNSCLKVFTMSDDSIDLSIKRKGIRKFLRNIASRYINGIIFPSNQVGNWYNKNVNSGVSVFELPIVHDNSIFRQNLKQVLPISEKYIHQFNLIDKTVFLFVGRLVKIKNIEFLIRGFAESCQVNDKLVIVGDGEEYEYLNQLINKLALTDSCIMTGRFEGDELIAWYNVAQCFILPSYLERYGAVVNEALLSGCKVLCSEIAGASVLIDDNNGFIFNPFNKSQFSEQIKIMSSNCKPLSLPLQLKPDLMPFDLNEKFAILLDNLK
jgi:glycosyltransferase involved in cell wall biosynthesis